MRLKLRRGFTLVELMVALTVGGLVLLSARALLESASDVAARLTIVTLGTDRVGNGDRLLHTLAARAEVGTPWAHTFGGDETSVHFGTWCDTPTGRLMPCDAVIRFERDGESLALVTQLSPFRASVGLGSERLILRRGLGSGKFRYLNDPAAGGQWFAVWGDAVVAPVAVGVIVDGDTTILRLRG